MSIVERITTAVLDRTVIIQQALCTRFLTPKSSCTLCADLCPVEAITFSEAGPDVGPSCLSCGVCHSACPTGAMGLSQDDDTSLIEDLDVAEGKETFGISCLRGDGKADLRVSCLGRLTEFLLLQPLHHNPDVRLEIMQPTCDECPMNRAMARFENLLSRVRHLHKLAGAEQETVFITRIPLQPLTRNNAARENGSRREFLQALRNKTTVVMTAALPQGQKKAGSLVPAYREQKPENHKRTNLLASLRTLTEKSQNQPLYIPSSESLIADISFNYHCTACGVCAAVCPTGALKLTKNTETISISFHAGSCVGCGICAAVCRSSAIESGETVLLNTMLNQNDVNVFTTTRRECRICRLDFTGQDVGGVCPLCVHRSQRRQNAIQNLFQTREL
jgi:ferredoxin